MDKRTGQHCSRTRIMHLYIDTHKKIFNGKEKKKKEKNRGKGGKMNNKLGKGRRKKGIGRKKGPGS